MDRALEAMIEMYEINLKYEHFVTKRSQIWFNLGMNSSAA